MPNAMPLGTVRPMKRWGTLINMVKVSHHGPKWERWRPQAVIEAEKQMGPLPASHQVYHRDGDSLNDASENLVVARENRLQINLERSRTSQRKQHVRRTAAVQRSNRMRGRIRRSVQLSRERFYPVSHTLRTILLQPFRTKHQAVRLGAQAEYRELQLVAVRGARLETEYPDYTRLIPDEGQAWTWRRIEEAAS